MPPIEMLIELYLFVYNKELFIKGLIYDYEEETRNSS